MKTGILAGMVMAAVMVMTSGVYAGDDSFNILLAKADTANGVQVAQQCAVCHTFQKGGPNMMGPNLWNVAGNVRASAANFQYSDALKGMHAQKWTYDALNQYLINPAQFAPGNRMDFSGLKNEKDRADLIAWLRTHSDNPPPLPAAKSK